MPGLARHKMDHWYGKPTTSSAKLLPSSPTILIGLGKLHTRLFDIVDEYILSGHGTGTFHPGPDPHLVARQFERIRTVKAYDEDCIALGFGPPSWLPLTKLKVCNHRTTADRLVVSVLLCVWLGSIPTKWSISNQRQLSQVLRPDRECWFFGCPRLQTANSGPSGNR